MMASIFRDFELARIGQIFKPLRESDWRRCALIELEIGR
jgi:hypothetical protein